MTGKMVPPADTGPEEKVLEDVQRHGWHVIKVLPERDTPGWAYTIGLYHSFGHPELIVFGLPLDTAHAVLNIAGTAVKGGKTFEPEVPHDDFLEGYDCVLRPVDARWHNAFVGFGLWFHQRADFPLLQLFWPDREGVMPWEPVASPWLRANQPSLYESSAAAARVGALLDTMEHGAEEDSGCEGPSRA